jgi:hypothetical protein
MSSDSASCFLSYSRSNLFRRGVNLLRCSSLEGRRPIPQSASVRHAALLKPGEVTEERNALNLAGPLNHAPLLDPRPFQVISQPRTAPPSPLLDPPVAFVRFLSHVVHCPPRARSFGEKSPASRLRCQANSNAGTHGRTPKSPADHFLRVVAEYRSRLVLRQSSASSGKARPDGGVESVTSLSDMATHCGPSESGRVTLTDLALPRPGKSTFHFTFVLASHLFGGFATGEVP